MGKIGKTVVDQWLKEFKKDLGLGRKSKGAERREGKAEWSERSERNAAFSCRLSGGGGRPEWQPEAAGKRSRREKKPKERPRVFGYRRTFYRGR